MPNRQIPIVEVPEYTRPHLEDMQWLRAAVAEVEAQKISARSVGRYAVHAGLLLIGTTVPKDRHYPVRASQHQYGDLRDGQKVKQYAPEGSKFLQVGSNVDIAIMCGLFGDTNDTRQQEQRCQPITGLPAHNFGWGTDLYKSYVQGRFPNEEAHVRPHARPELINAALDPEKPFTGSIDCVYTDDSLVRVDHEIGQYLTPRSHRTVLRIPLTSHLDLPFDIIATDYEDLSSMAVTTK